MPSKKYESLKKKILARGGIFQDEEFPPSFLSLFPTGRWPASLARYNRRDITWKRPGELSDNPKFMVSKTSRFDIDQGILGDCWFLTAAGSLFTVNPKYLEKVMPMDQSFEPGKYTGMFCFNFWWYGNWTEIIIDDLIPCIYDKPMCSKNEEHPNEFWPCLLEKAYAKLRGGYWNMNGGRIGDAMVDMTGGVSEVIMNKQLNVDLLKKAFAMETMLGAGCMVEAKGLQPGHAYLITGLKDLKLENGTTVELIRIRNPWGDSHEWNGPWSDNSYEMKNLSTALKAELEFEKKEDGEFWMTIPDYRKYFAETHFCHVHPDTILEELEDNERKIKWNVKSYHDRWVRGVSAGGWKQRSRSFWQNPQYFVTLKEPDCHLCDTGHCTFIASLLEKQYTTSNTSKIAKGFFVYEVKGDALDKMEYDTHVDQQDIKNINLGGKSFEFTMSREVTQRFELQPGTYAIIPCTQYTGEEAEFILRIYTENHSECGSLDGEHKHEHGEHGHEHGAGEDEHEHGEDGHDDGEDGHDHGKTEEDKEEKEARVIKPGVQDHVYEAFETHRGEDGKMYPSELASFMDDLSYSELSMDMISDMETCRTLVMMKNERGYLNYPEAKAVWEEIRLLKVAFKKFDKDRSDTIDSMELKSFLKTLLKFEVSRDLVTPVVRRYGGRDNQIKFPDFLMLYFKLKSFAEMYRPSTSKEEFLTMSMFN